jgi:hypothetical protein
MLEAVDLYRQKGTPSGLKKMAEILTGHKCYVKEYMNNVFRTYGMDQCLEPRDKDCSRFPRTVSMTVDCSNEKLLERIGKYDDKVHYAWDSSSDIPHSIYSVAVFVKNWDGEHDLEISPSQIKSILEPFIPAFLNLRVVFLQDDGVDDPLMISQRRSQHSVVAEDHHFMRHSQENDFGSDWRAV